MGSQTVVQYVIRDRIFDVVGFWDKGLDEGYDGFDIFLGNRCLNLGDPYPTAPTKDMVEDFLSQFTDEELS